MENATKFAGVYNTPNLAKWVKNKTASRDYPDDLKRAVENGNDIVARDLAMAALARNSHCLDAELLDVAAANNMDAFLTYVFENGLQACLSKKNARGSSVPLKSASVAPAKSESAPTPQKPESTSAPPKTAETASNPKCGCSVANTASDLSDRAFATFFMSDNIPSSQLQERLDEIVGQFKEMISRGNNCGCYACIVAKCFSEYQALSGGPITKETLTTLCEQSITRLQTCLETLKKQ